MHLDIMKTLSLWHWIHSQIRTLVGAHNRPFFLFFFSWSGYMVENKTYVKHQIHKLVSSDSGMLCISFLVSKAILSFIIRTLPEKTSPFAHSFSVVWTPLVFMFTYCWSRAWRILSITLLVCEMSMAVWTFFGIAFLWNWNEIWPLQSSGHCQVFQICWYIKCSILTASSLRIDIAWLEFHHLH